MDNCNKPTAASTLGCPHLLKSRDKDYLVTSGEAEAWMKVKDCSRPLGQLFSVSQAPRGFCKASGKHGASPQEPAGQQDLESGNQKAMWP